MKAELQRQNRKVTAFTKLDILLGFILYGYLAYEYVAYHFEEKSRKERRQYYSEMEKWIFMSICNTKGDRWKLTDKSVAYNIFKDGYKREQILIKSKKDFEQFKGFATRHSVFFAKPYAGGGGVGARWMDVNKYPSIEESFNALLKDGSFVLEEGVYQCKEMASFNPDSINTVRIVTIRANNKPRIWQTLIRTGRKGSIVDNGASGGLFVLVDPDSGKLISGGANEKGEYYLEHPDSKIPFIGFQVPMWKEVCDFSLKMMECLPTIRCIGWDLAITDNGPVIIEANGQPVLSGLQLVLKKGLRKEYDEVLKTLK